MGGRDQPEAIQEAQRTRTIGASRPTPTAHASAAPNPNARRMNGARTAPAICWTNITSMAETHHEVTRRQTLDRRRRPQDQRQPRRGLLERHEGNLGPAEHDAVGTGRRDRQQSPAGQPVLGDPPFRAGLFPQPRHPACGRRRTRRARRRKARSVLDSNSRTAAFGVQFRCAPRVRAVSPLSRPGRCRAASRALRPTSDTPRSRCRRSLRSG